MPGLTGGGLMAVKSIEVFNVMAFFTEIFQLQFCDGINIIIGENGVGKTTILKMIYAALQASLPEKKQGNTQRIAQLFSNNITNAGLLESKNSKGQSYYKVSYGQHTFTQNISGNFILEEGWHGQNIQSVFIPAMEMLSHSQGFLALNQKYKLPFDGTQMDIIINASLPEVWELPDYMEPVLSKISSVIDGIVTMENDIFYILKNNGMKIEFSLEAEGLRKLGLLWKLIRNGLLEEGTVLLWDEPEANLNPELFPLVADILLELERAGIQIFIATHSYNLAKYFELRRNNEKEVQYHNLYKNLSVTGKGIISEKPAYYLSQLNKNKIIDADERLKGV